MLWKKNEAMLAGTVQELEVIVLEQGLTGEGEERKRADQV